jgi:hypothetical protein
VEYTKENQLDVIPLLNSNLLSTLFTDVLLEEEHIPEIHLINLTDWGWLLLLSGVIFAIWLLIIFQISSKGSHPFGMLSDSESSHEFEEH